jgi:hypothetical protein
MQIDRTLHFANADPPIVETLEPASNVTLERSEQSMKQYFEISRTDEGMHIDVRGNELKAASPRVETLLAGEKVTDLMEV